MAKKSPLHDEFGNLQGKRFDLGGEDDSRLKGEKVLLCVSYDGENLYANAKNLLVPTMLERNLTLEVVKFRDFRTILERGRLSEYAQLWYLSDKVEHLSSQHVRQIVDYNKAGGGLLIWADNDPFYADANLLARAAVNSTFQGNQPGNELLKPGDRVQPGFFIEHQLTFGLNSLYEGWTICDIVPGAGIEIVAQSHDGQRCMGAFVQGDQRVVLDTGFTKIMNREAYFRTAGTARYFNNVAFWLARGARDSQYKLLTGAENLATVQQGQTSEWLGYDLRQPAGLRFVLGWHTGDEVGLEIYDPNGNKATSQQSRQSPLQIEIPGAAPGVWKCRVRGVNIAQGSLQYVLMVVEQQGAVFSPPPTRSPAQEAPPSAPQAPQSVDDLFNSTAQRRGNLPPAPQPPPKPNAPNQPPKPPPPKGWGFDDE